MRKSPASVVFARTASLEKRFPRAAAHHWSVACPQELSQMFKNVAECLAENSRLLLEMHPDRPEEEKNKGGRPKKAKGEGKKKR